MNFLVHHLLRSSAERHASRAAFVVGSRRWTFEQLWRDVQHLAAALRAMGVRRGDRVGIFLPAGAEQTLAILAASAADAVFVPIHASLQPPQVEHIARDCDLRVLFTSERLAETLHDLPSRCPALEAFVLAGPDEDSRDPSADNRLSQTESPTGRLASLAPGTVARHRFAELLRASVALPAASWREACIEKDLAAILYTSGSTGLPKGVMLSHANVLSGAAIVADYLRITAEDRILAVLPFSFDAGLNQLMTSLQQGATLVSLSFLLPKQIVTALVRERITGLAGVPTLWSLLAHSDSFQQARYPDLRYITNTGGRMPGSVLQILRRTLTGVDIYLMYGLTEAFRSTYLPPEQLDRRPDSIGRAIPNTEILVVDEHGQPCASGEEGELVHHGPTVALGYWRRPELTAAVWRPHPFPTPGLPPETRVCYSGDLVRRDDEGYLYFVGRRDNQIKTSGFRVSPTEVEEALHTTGLVTQAAVIGVPDEMLGQRIVAFVIPKQATDLDAGQREAEILRCCAALLPAYMIPRHVRLVDSLPHTASRKIDYGSLRELWSTEEPPSSEDAAHE